MAEKISTSVVGINNQNGEIIGTGFMIAKGVIATCAHVVAEACEPDQVVVKETAITITFTTLEANYSATVISFNKENDIAILQVKETLPVNITISAICSPDNVRKPIDFLTFGYRELGEREGIPAKGILVESTLKADGPSLVLESKQIGPGMSGAPLYIPEFDRVVGIITSFWDDRDRRIDAETAFAQPAEIIQKAWPSLQFIPPKSNKIPQPKSSPLKWIITSLFFTIILAMLAIFFFYPTPTPTMAGDVKVVFPSLKSGPPPPNLSVDDLARRTDSLAKNVAKSIGTEIKSDKAITFDVWGPEKLRNIPFSSDDIQSIAQKVNANMVLYGTLGENDSSGLLSLGLYVTNVSFEEAGELLGTYYIGSPVEYQPPFENIAAQEKSSRVVQQRIETVTALVLGISRLISSKDLALAQKNFDDALAIIRQDGEFKLIQPSDCPPGFTPPNLKIEAADPRAEATIFVLKGNAAMQSEKYEEALSFYEHAIVLRCDFARPYIGMATALHRQALRNLPDSVDLEQDIKVQKGYSTTLALAEKYFTWAESATWRPEKSLFNERLHYYRSEWHLARSLLPGLGVGKELAAVSKECNELITLYENTLPENKQNPFLKDIVASAYGNRAFVETDTDPNQAIRDYEQAKSIEFDQNKNLFFTLRIGQIYASQGNCKKAHQLFQLALKSATKEELKQVIQKSLDKDCKSIEEDVK